MPSDFRHSAFDGQQGSLGCEVLVEHSRPLNPLQLFFFCCRCFLDTRKVDTLMFILMRSVLSTRPRISKLSPKLEAHARATLRVPKPYCKASKLPAVCECERRKPRSYPPSGNQKTQRSRTRGDVQVIAKRGAGAE